MILHTLYSKLDKYVKGVYNKKYKMTEGVLKVKSKSSILFWGLYDIMILVVSFLLTLMLVNNFSVDAVLLSIADKEAYVFLLAIVPHLIVMSSTHTYRVLWQFAGPYDYIKLALAPMFTAILMILAAIIFRSISLDLNVYIIYYILSTAFVVVPRLFVKLYVKVYDNHRNSPMKGTKRKNVMIIGAGEAARILITDINRNDRFAGSKVVCVIDDEEAKQSKFINGIEIVGTRHDIHSAAKKYEVDVIIFAIPSLARNERREILDICSKTGCELKTMPSIDDVVNKMDDNSLLKVSDVKIEDLLERLPIDLVASQNMNYVTDKVVLVTGGGGSIGSELCRQLVAYEPKLLIIFDVYENNAYDILNELKTNYPEANVIALIGSVRDSKRMECLFSKYRPEIVYHAAAHKHVPLMEDSPNEAIKNNVFGTFKTAQMADKYGTRRFVLISTDKAVNPTNIMGASKRMCEMVVQSFSRRSKTEFVAVRFGNVLGSNGSVIPLFKKQIEQGGPVKVTHPDIIRYFMTIPEAVSLVLTAGAMAKGGEIFVLDMGKPVKILDLAKNMIRLMGYEVDKDIKIEFIGLRPGEKLFEELLMDEEGMKCTENKLIHIGKPIEFDDRWFFDKLGELKETMYDDSCDIKQLVSEIVPTYRYKKQ